MEKPMNPVFKIIDRLSLWSGYFSAAAILVSTLIIVEQVVARYVFRAATVWQVESAVYLLIAATFVGSAYGLRENAHINIDLLIINLAGTTRKWLDITTSAVAMGFCLFLAYRGSIMWWEAYEGGWKSSSILSMPLIYPYACLPVGMFLTSLQYVVRISHKIDELRKR